jgi:transcriptional repressor NrdR
VRRLRHQVHHVRAAGRGGAGRRQARDGRRDPFDRCKIEVGVRSACKGRPVGESSIAQLALTVEDRLPINRGEVEAGAIGELVLDELRQLDPVAALRFASVYKSFEDPEDFEREIQLLSGTAAQGPEPTTAS